MIKSYLRYQFKGMFYSENKGDTMEQYIYRGESEKDFYMEFVHNVRCDYLKSSTDDRKVESPYGTIVVPKDYDTCWMANRNFYLGWRVVVAPVAKEFIKGFNG